MLFDRNYILPMFILGRDTNTCAYIKRRLAMCARKLGRVKEAVKLMKEVKIPMVFYCGYYMFVYVQYAGVYEDVKNVIIWSLAEFDELYILILITSL